MKKTFCRVITLVTVCCMLAAVFCISASAASASIHFSDPSATVGSTVTVNVSIGEAVAFYDVRLSYDSSMLEYVSCSGSTGNFSGWGGGGSVSINDYATSGAGSFSCSITFKALKSGTANVNVAYSDLVDTNGDAMEVSCGYSAVTISNPVTASSDSSLKELSISPGTLSPSFSAGTKNYTATVSSGTTSVVVSAIKNHSAASVSVSGGNNLSVGTNNVYITVTAEDGSQSTYTIVVTRPASTVTTPTTPNTGDNNNEKPEPEPEEPTEAYAVLVTGETLKVSDTIEDEAIPAGFTKTETTVENITVPAVTFGENGKVYVYLEGKGDVPSGFYTIDEETGFAYPMETFSRSEEQYIVIGTSELETPVGYKADKITVGDMEYDVFVPETPGDYEHCLIYLINEKGECWLYTYDPADGSLQRYGITGDIVTVIEPEPEPEPEPIPEPEPEKEQTFFEIVFGNKAVFWSAVGLAALAVVLLVIIIILGIMYSRKTRACRLMAAARAHADVGNIPDMPDMSELPEISDIPDVTDITKE